jgi:hypothetical protein
MTDMSIIHYRHFEPERVQGYQTLSKDDTAALVSSFPI